MYISFTNVQNIGMQILCYNGMATSAFEMHVFVFIDLMIEASMQHDLLIVIFIFMLYLLLLCHSLLYVVSTHVQFNNFTMAYDYV